MITIVGAMDAASKPMLAEAYETKSALVPSQPEPKAEKRNEESSMQIDRPSHAKSGIHAIRSSRRVTSLSHGSCTLSQQHCRDQLPTWLAELEIEHQRAVHNSHLRLAGVKLTASRWFCHASLGACMLAGQGND